jgi:hypothetical protein
MHKHGTSLMIETSRCRIIVLYLGYCAGFLRERELRISFSDQHPRHDIVSPAAGHDIVHNIVSKSGNPPLGAPSRDKQLMQNSAARDTM